MDEAERVRAYMFDDHVVVLVDNHEGETHRHGALQLSVSLDGEPHRLGPSDDARRPGRVMLVGANETHSFWTNRMAAIYWIAPDSLVGAQLAQNYLSGDPIVALPEAALAGVPLDGLRRALLERWSAERFMPESRHFLASLSSRLPERSRAIHPAIRKAGRIIRGRPQKRIGARELAQEVGLSESRLLHLYKEHLGMPLRAHLRWLRLMDGLRAALSEGKSLTEAAHHAGFTDAAHFNRAVHQYFAVNPTTVAAEILMEFVSVLEAPDGD